MSERMEEQLDNLRIIARDNQVDLKDLQRSFENLSNVLIDKVHLEIHITNGTKGAKFVADVANKADAIKLLDAYLKRKKELSL